MDFVPVVKETHLSRKPARGSFWVALASLGVLLAVSAAYWLDFHGLASRIPATPETVLERAEYWRPFTSIAAHADFRHLLANGLVFGVLSFLLYGYFGPVAYPALAWGLGAIVTTVSLATYPPHTALLGASGVVYWMAGFWLTLYLFIETSRRFGRRLLRAVGFGLLVLAPTAWDPTVSHRTHLLGFVVGVGAGICYFGWKRSDFRAAEKVEWE